MNRSPFGKSNHKTAATKGRGRRPRVVAGKSGKWQAFGMESEPLLYGGNGRVSALFPEDYLINDARLPGSATWRTTSEHCS